MLKNKRAFNILALFIISLSIFASFFIFVAKAANKVGQPNSKRGVIISPLAIFTKGQKGQTLTTKEDPNLKYSITNDFETIADINVYPKTANFIQNENNGSIIIDTNKRNTDDDLASWIQLQSNAVTLKHNEMKEFNFSIKIPQNATGGTHSAVILFPRSESSYIRENNNTIVGANDQLALPVILTISSDIDFKSEISDINVTNILNQRKSFFWGGTARVYVTVKNPGNIYVRPFGNLMIHRGDKTKPLKVYEFNPDGLQVQQKNKRKFQFDYVTGGFIEEKIENDKITYKIHWNKFFDFKFGRHYATYQARIKASNESDVKDKYITIEKTASFFVFPIQILIIIAILTPIITVAFIYFFIKLRSKSSVEKSIKMKAKKI